MTRRNFLKLTTQGLLGLAGLLGLSGLIRFLSFQPDPPPPKQFEIGLASDYPPDSRTTRPEIPALIIHSANGIQAISLVCTHLGCTVEVKSKSFACPCHGSQFDQAGKVTKGPASKPLETLKIEQTAEGNLIVSKD